MRLPPPAFLDVLAFHLEGPTSKRVVLDARLRYRSKAGVVYESPEGFTCDLASVPKIVRSLSSSWIQTARAGTMHDLLCRWAEWFGISQGFADALYYEMLRVEGVSRWRAWLQWSAVRTGGRRAWRRWRATNDDDKGPQPRPAHRITIR